MNLLNLFSPKCFKTKRRAKDCADMSNKVLFILKKNELYSFSHYCRRSSGLWNSTGFIVQALNERGIEAKIIEVEDNNDIDREVNKYKPTLVVIEALWVVPDKFKILKKLHPKVKWAVHLHSQIPFLSLEGMAMEWIRQYPKEGVHLIANSNHAYLALQAVVDKKDITLLHNVFLQNKNPIDDVRVKYYTVFRVACLGAIRPLKNQLLQALAAIEFADKHKKTLLFFINGSRVETGGQPVLKNIRALFENSKHRLVEVDWMEQETLDNFLPEMDLGMQVSLSETFNVVTANYITAGIPVVVSKEIFWVSPRCVADENNIKSIVERMEHVLKYRKLTQVNKKLLSEFADHSIHEWVKFIRSNS